MFLTKQCSLAFPRRSYQRSFRVAGGTMNIGLNGQAAFTSFRYTHCWEYIYSSVTVDVLVTHATSPSCVSRASTYDRMARL